MSDDLYQQEILDHYHHPDNFGELKHADEVIEESNASCGDSFTFYLQLDSQKNTIKQIHFTGQGCAISTAACSLITSALKNKSVSTIKSLNLDYMQTLLHTQITPMRVKCLMLPAKALSQLVKNG